MWAHILRVLSLADYSHKGLHRMSKLSKEVEARYRAGVSFEELHCTRPRSQATTALCEASDVSFSLRILHILLRGLLGTSLHVMHCRAFRTPLRQIGALSLPARRTAYESTAAARRSNCSSQGISCKHARDTSISKVISPRTDHQHRRRIR